MFVLLRGRGVLEVPVVWSSAMTDMVHLHDYWLAADSTRNPYFLVSKAVGSVTFSITAEDRQRLKGLSTFGQDTEHFVQVDSFLSISLAHWTKFHQLFCLQSWEKFRMILVFLSSL